MKLYIVRTEKMDADKIDYSMILGVFDNKEDAKKVARKALEAQKGFWEGSIVYRDLGGPGKGMVRVVLTNGELTARYLIEEKELNESRYNN